MKPIRFTCLFVFFIAAFAAKSQTEAWLFSNKKSSQTDTLLANEIVYTFWKSSPSRAVEARFLNIRNDSIFLKIEAATIGTPLANLEKITIKRPLSEEIRRQKIRRRFMLACIGIMLAFIGSLVALNNDDSCAPGCFSTILIVIVFGLSAFMLRHKTVETTIDKPLQKWDIRQIEVP